MNGQECVECGMLVEPPNSYHPYAACLMFKACRDGNIVQANLDAVVAHGYQLSLDQESADCFRGHPHENMAPNCELRTDITRLQASVRTSEQERDELMKALESIFVEFSPEHLDHVSGTTVGTDASATLSQYKQKGGPK